MPSDVLGKLDWSQDSYVEDPSPSESSERLDLALRRALEDQTEDILYALYDYVAPELAAAFRQLEATGNDQIRVLADLGRSLGLEIDKVTSADRDVDRLAWQPVARSAALFLFSWLVDTIDVGASRRLTAHEWAEGVDETLDRDLFIAQTALPPSDVGIALGLTARAVTRWERLQRWEFMFFRGMSLALYTDAADESLLVTVARDLPLGVLISSGTDDVVPDHQGHETDVPEAGIELVLSLDDVQVYESGGALKFETPRLAQCPFATLEMEEPFAYRQKRRGSSVWIGASGDRSAKLHLGSGIAVVDATKGLLLQGHLVKH
jgi:hypothetical protein